MVDAGPQPQPIGGTVSGLGTNAGLVLALNGGNDLAITGDGGFTFPTAANLLPGASYDVSIKNQPTGKTCKISAGSGTVANAPVTSVVVNCDGGKFTVGGNITGLAAGASVVLTNNGAEDVTANGNNTFAFPTALGNGASYAVTVKTQPSTPVQTCTVTNGTGTILSADVTNVAVACTTATFNVKVAVTGLIGGSSVVLTNNGGDNLTVNGNSTVPFATKVASGGAFAVAVATNPSGQTCTVGAGATGTVGSADVTVPVTCSTASFTVGGSLTGLNAGSSITLKDTSALGGAGETVTVNADGTFTFPSPRNSGSSYNVTVPTQPAGQTCSVTGGAGIVSAGNVTSVVVNCASGTYTVGGVIKGLIGLQIPITNGSESRNFSGNGADVNLSGYAPLTNGTNYNFVVGVQPTYHKTGATVDGRDQTCTVANGSGTVAGANKSDVVVTCTTNKFKVQGQLTGLAAGSTVKFQNTVAGAGVESSTVTVTGNGSLTDTFTFPTIVSSGNDVTVTVIDNDASAVNGNVTPAAGKPDQTCTASVGSGTVTDGDLSTIRFNCTVNTYQIALTTTNIRSGSTGSVTFSQHGTAGGNPSNTTNIPRSSNGTSGISPALDSATSYTLDTVNSSGLSPKQTCAFTAGATGTVTTASAATLNCKTDTGTIGGNMVGLQNPGTNTSGLHLTYTGVDVNGIPNGSTSTSTLFVGANGAFNFPAGVQLASGTTYSVNIPAAEDPVAPPQVCRFTGGGTLSDGVCFNGGPGNNNGTACTSNADCTGGGQCAFKTLTATATGVDATNLSVSCATNAWVVGGTVGGYVAQTCNPATDNTCGMELTLHQVAPAGPADQVVRFNPAGGTFSFPTAVVNGATYTIAITGQPTYGAGRLGSRQQQCTISPPGGAATTSSTLGPITGDTPNAAAITCVTTSYGIGGNIANWEAGSNLQIQLASGATTTTLTDPGASYTFVATPAQIQSGDTYTLSILNNGDTTGTPELVCTFDSTGTYTVSNLVANSAPASQAITCHRKKYKFQPAIQFLASGTTVGLTVHLTGCGEACAADQAIVFTSTSDTDSTPITTFNDVPNGAGITLTVTTNPTNARTGLLPQNCQISLNNSTYANSQTGTMPKNDYFGSFNAGASVDNISRFPALSNNFVLRCGQGSTCNQIKLGDPSIVSGFYPLDIDGTGPMYAARVYCDYTTDPAPGTSYTYLRSTDGLDTTNISQTNSCQIGGTYQIVTPRSLAHINKMFALFTASSFKTVPGIYRTGGTFGNSVNISRAYTSCALRRLTAVDQIATDCNGGAAPFQPISDWTSTAGATGWIVRNVSYSEPNGDYQSGMWLGNTGTLDGNGFIFNDLPGGYATGPDYICSPNDKNPN